MEQVGVRLGDKQPQIECGEEIWSLCGRLEEIEESFVQRPLQTHDRWSYFGTNPTFYLCGPISMINHACRLHFNVSFHKMRLRRTSAFEAKGTENMVAVAERRIEAGDRIYAVYDYDEDGLMKSRGIACTICAKIK